MMRPKLLHRIKEVCGATSRMMENELIVGEHKVDGPAFIYIFILFFHTCINFFSNLHHK